MVVRGTASSSEIVLVHRPQYDDWTIPKGKDDPGESSQQAALREVQEETGLICRVTGSAGVSRYAVADGMKQVEYFLMRPFRSTVFHPNDEVDEVRWVPTTQAKGLLTYDFDRKLVSEVDLATATAHTDIHLVRHGAAGDRSTWNGPDVERPLTKKGLEQADALASGLGGIGVERVLSSPAVRCLQTVAPLALLLGIEVEVDDRLAEGSDGSAITRLLDDIAGTNTVLSSHGDVIPVALERLQGLGVRFHSPYECRKGSTWSIGHDGEAFTDADYVVPPRP